MEQFDKYYVVLEQSPDKLKLRHRSTGDIQYRHRAKCNSCGCDRGWKKKAKLNDVCMSCSQHRAYINTLDKNLYSNVNFNDVIISNKTSRERFQYRTTCDNCGTDIGYKAITKVFCRCEACQSKN